MEKQLRSILKIALVTLSTIGIYNPIKAQWSPAIKVVLGSGFGSLATQGNNVHVVYDNNSTITYKRSIDEGTTWATEIPLASGVLHLDRPICVDSANLYIVYFGNTNLRSDWCCSRELGDLFVIHSTDKGVTWQSPVQITTAKSAFRVGMIASGPNVYLTWMDYRSGNTWDIYFRKSSDYGVTWQSELKLVAGKNSFGEERPDIVVNGNSVHLFWMGASDSLPACNLESITLPNCSEIFYKRSLNGGASWGSNIRLNTTDVYAGRPIATVVPPNTIVTSWEGNDGSGDLLPYELEPYTLRSINNGTSWDTVQRIRYLPNDAGHQNLTSNGDTVHIAWHDSRNLSNQEIYYRQSIDGGATWGLEELVSNTPAASQVPCLGTTTKYVHALWGDNGEPWYSRRLLKDTAISVCPSPTTLTFINITSTSVTANWSPVSGATSYIIGYRLNSNFVWTYDTIPGSSTNITLNGLTPGTDYVCSIKANCSGFIPELAFSTSVATGVSANNNTSQNFNIVIQPNPTSGNTIAVNTFLPANEKYRLTLYNSLGEVLYKTEASAQQTFINMSQYNSGIYYISISSKNLISMKKIINNY